MTASTQVYANTLAMNIKGRIDGERIVRIVEAKTVESAFKMLGDYGFAYTDGATVDGFIAEDTNRLIEFITDTVPNEKAAKALTARFWYNNVKLAYKSRFADVPSDGFYAVEGDAVKVARGDYSDCDKYLAAALEALDEAHETKPQAIDIALTRAMYKFVLSCGVSLIKKYFRAEIDMKNILTAARAKKLGKPELAEFLDGGTLKQKTLDEAMSADGCVGFAECFEKTPYAALTESIAEGFDFLGDFERSTDDYLFYMTDSAVAKIASFEPYLNFYTQTLIELKTVKTALVCIKTDSRDAFYARMPKIYVD